MIPSIVVDQVCKRFSLGKGLVSLRELFSVNAYSESKNYHWALRDVSFTLNPGESLGIIGPNGAGKTTMLKVLSRVSQPTSGEMMVNGRLSALIELGAGFHQDLSGRENIFLNGTILGMRRSEIKARFDQIVDFAGIGEYLDTPVKRYSSGMYARLGFAIAAHVDPQVLLVDEVLAVGDFAFQMKCYARMDELRKMGTALIFVSHNMEAVRRVCEHGLVMYRGEAIFQGTAAESIVAYSDAIRNAARKNSQLAVPEDGGVSQRIMTFDAEILDVRLVDDKGESINVVSSSATVRLVVDVVFNRDVQQPNFSLIIRTTDGRVVYDITSQWMGIETPNYSAGERCRLEYTLNMPLLDGSYDLGVDITPSNLSHFYDCLERALTFSIVGVNEARGIVDLGAQIDIQKLSIAGNSA